MTTKDEVRSTVEALSVVDTLKLALEFIERTSTYLPTSFDDEGLALHAAIREALAAVPEAHKQSAEIPQSITCPFCESQHVPGWLHDYNMDRMKKPAPATPLREQQSAERVEPVLWLVNGVIQASDIPKDYTGCLFTSPPANANAGKPLTDEQMAVLNFMLGADDLDGVWFGERHPKEKGAFWWRKCLRRLFTYPPYEATPLASQRSIKPWVHATTWRGLTDEERSDIINAAYDDHYNRRVSDTDLEIAKAVEFKLREKNA